MRCMLSGAVTLGCRLRRNQRVRTVMRRAVPQSCPMIATTMVFSSIHPPLTRCASSEASARAVARGIGEVTPVRHPFLVAPTDDAIVLPAPLVGPLLFLLVSLALLRLSRMLPANHIDDGAEGSWIDATHLDLCDGVTLAPYGIDYEEVLYPATRGLPPGVAL